MLRNIRQEYQHMDWKLSNRIHISISSRRSCKPLETNAKRLYFKESLMQSMPLKLRQDWSIKKNIWENNRHCIIRNGLRQTEKKEIEMLPISRRTTKLEPRFKHFSLGWKRRRPMRIMLKFKLSEQKSKQRNLSRKQNNSSMPKSFKKKQKKLMSQLKHLSLLQLQMRKNQFQLLLRKLPQLLFTKG